MKKKIGNFKELIKQLKSTDRGRAILFFSGYLIFFIIVFIIIGTSGRIQQDIDDYEKGEKNSFNFDKITDNNYSFNYNITIDVNDYKYKGSRYDNLELFEYKDINYFRDFDKKDIYKEENDTWNKCDNPNDLDEFTEIDKVIKLIDSANFSSKTEYESGKKRYNYKISTTTIEEIINNNYIDLDDKPNKIIISTDEDENVNSIKMVLDNYGIYKQLCVKYLTIELKYDDFGKIKEIKSPINE